MPPAGKPPGSGSIAYCVTYADSYDSGGHAALTISGCILDGSSAVSDPASPRFTVTIPLRHGDGQSELASAVMGELAAQGVRGLADVKFIPAF